eukprot:NODE_21_length_42443_cov_0.822808.p10 type:complete len:359 gc:universal NODE_21_length_42443_cov_0.822808:4468-3392(-)
MNKSLRDNLNSTQKSLEKGIDKESSSLFSKMTTSRKKNEDPSKRLSLVPKKNERNQKKTHIQPHFNMRLIDEIKTSPTISSHSLQNLEVLSQPTTAILVDATTTETRVSNQESTNRISRTKTILQSKIDTDIVLIIDELNNLAQNRTQAENDDNSTLENDFADQFLKKLSYLTDSLVQPRLENIKFVSGNLKENDHSPTSVSEEIITSQKIIELFENEPMAIDRSQFIDAETMTEWDHSVFEKKDGEVQTEDYKGYEIEKHEEKECQTDTLLVMSNALVGQLWKLNEALTTKVKEYDEAMQKQNEVVDELRERNKILWAEVRQYRNKESKDFPAGSQVFQTLSRKDIQSLTLTRNMPI